MTFLIFICLAAFFWLLRLLRKDRVSLGLPIAYLFGLLLIHLPGAFAHVVGDFLPSSSDLTEIGMRFTALGRCVLSRVCGWPVPRPQECQSVGRRIARTFGGFACSAGGLASTASVPSTISPVSALRLIRGEGFGCWA